MLLDGDFPLVDQIRQPALDILDLLIQLGQLGLHVGLQGPIRVLVVAVVLVDVGFHHRVDDLGRLIRVPRGQPHPDQVGLIPDDHDVQQLSQVGLRVLRRPDHRQVADPRLGQGRVQHAVAGHQLDLGQEEGLGVAPAVLQGPRVVDVDVHRVGLQQARRLVSRLHHREDQVEQRRRDHRPEDHDPQPVPAEAADEDPGRDLRRRRLRRDRQVSRRSKDRGRHPGGITGVASRDVRVGPVDGVHLGCYSTNVLE